MLPEPWMTLLHTHKHPRDTQIYFDEPTHVYTVNGSSKGIISCTKFLHEFFGHFDAKSTIKKMMTSPKWKESKWNKPGATAKSIEEEWNTSGKEASALGTAMHLAIEQFRCCALYRKRISACFREARIGDYRECTGCKLNLCMSRAARPPMRQKNSPLR